MSPKAKLILTLGALAALGPLSIDMYLPAFPALERDLHTGPGPLSATLASFFAGLCLGQLLYGPVSDKVGRRKPLVMGLVIYVVASLGCTLTTSVEMLAVLRFFQALGSCSGMVIGRALVRDLFSPHETAKVFSLIMLVMGVAPILAPLGGEWITARFGWRAIFALTALFAVCTLGAVVKIVDNVRPSTPRKWRVSTLWKVVCDREFLGFALAGTFIQAGLFAYITGSAHFFIEQLNFTPRQFSLLFGLNAFGLIAASQLNNRLLRENSYKAILERVLLVALGASALLYLSSAIAPLAAILCLFVFVGSLGMVFPNSTAGALANQGERAGTASAVLGTIQYGGAALASACVGALHSVTPHALQWTILGCAILSVVVFRMLPGDERGAESRAN